jgi:pimeloyl-ACP methyl ester carboxylesterase
MTDFRVETGLAAINVAQIYYEIAGDGQPFVMIHAGVADSRQWNNEFVHFASSFRVLRYDMRGYGKSEPVEGEFSHLRDLASLLDHLDLTQPLILMGCSMGGALAMDFALAQPGRVSALIMVGSGPSGLDLDVPAPPKLEAVIKAYEAGDIDLLAELETQLWFDGTGRSATQVNQGMRQLAHEMAHRALSQEAKRLGKRLPDAEVPAAGRLGELGMPVLVVVGSHDTPYILAAADYMVERIPSARKAVIEDAAHLANMDQPDEFRHIITEFLDSLPR